MTHVSICVFAGLIAIIELITCDRQCLQHVLFITAAERHLELWLRPTPKFWQWLVLRLTPTKVMARSANARKRVWKSWINRVTLRSPGVQ